MKATAQMLFVLGMLLAPVEVIASLCSSYYISEITLVSPGDNEAGRVQTFVGFGASKEEAEKNALGSCSHIQLDLETCLASDRVLDRNAPSDEAKTSLHISTRRRSSASLAAINPTFYFSNGPIAEVGTPWTAPLKVVCFNATTLWHSDAAEWAVHSIIRDRVGQRQIRA